MYRGCRPSVINCFRLVAFTVIISFWGCLEIRPQIACAIDFPERPVNSRGGTISVNAALGFGVVAPSRDWSCLSCNAPFETTGYLAWFLSFLAPEVLPGPTCFQEDLVISNPLSQAVSCVRGYPWIEVYCCHPEIFPSLFITMTAFLALEIAVSTRSLNGNIPLKVIGCFAATSSSPPGWQGFSTVDVIGSLLKPESLSLIHMYEWGPWIAAHWPASPKQS